MEATTAQVAVGSGSGSGPGHGRVRIGSGARGGRQPGRVGSGGHPDLIAAFSPGQEPFRRRRHKCLPV